jgi:hypothetical protein
VFLIPGVRLHNFTKYKAKTKEENDEEEIKSENVITNHGGTLPGKKEKEEEERLFIEEELKWIRYNLGLKDEI